MNVWPSFNSSNGDVCPICKTSKNTDTVLVPIPGTEDGGNMQARQFHKKCFDLITEMNEK